MSETPVWTALQTPVVDTSKLTTEKGEKNEIILEDREVFATRYSKNKYTFECQLPVSAGDVKPIEDEDGIIVEQYALRLTPENEGADGWVMDNTAVSLIENWDSKLGATRTYTFNGLKPKSGKILKPYTKPVTE